jgi:hypothetical protein
LVSAFGIAACGGGDDNDGSSKDQDQITAAIDRAATSGDPAACSDVQTPRFVQQTNGGGSPAQSLKSCEQDAQDSVAHSVDVSDIEVDGDTATAKAAVTGSFFDGQTLDIALIKQGGRWKLDRFKGFEDFDRDSFLASFRHALSTEGGGAPAAAVDCVIKQADGLSDEQLEGAFTGSNKQAEDQLFQPCADQFKGQ